MAGLDRDIKNWIEKIEALPLKIAAVGGIAACVVKPPHEPIVYKGNAKLIQWLCENEEEFMSLQEFIPQGIKLRDRLADYDKCTVKDLRSLVRDILAKIPGSKVSWKSPKPLCWPSDMPFIDVSKNFTNKVNLQKIINHMYDYYKIPVGSSEPMYASASPSPTSGSDNSSDHYSSRQTTPERSPDQQAGDSTGSSIASLSDLHSDSSLDGYQSGQPTPVGSPVSPLQSSPTLPVTTTAVSDPVSQQASPLEPSSPVLNRRPIKRRRISHSHVSSSPTRARHIQSDDSANDGSSARAGGSSTRTPSLSNIHSAGHTQPTTEPPWLPEAHLASPSQSMPTPRLDDRVRDSIEFNELAKNWSATKKTRSGKRRK